MKRYISVAVLALLLLVLCSTSGLYVGHFFADVEPENPDYPYVMEVVQGGMMSGGENDLFGMGDPVSRREAMELFLEVIGAPVEPLIETAVANKLVDEVDETMLDEPLSRLEAARMAARALKLLPMSGESPYADCEDGYVVRLWEKGIWDSGAQFYPSEVLTRGELATLLWHMERVDLSVTAFRYNDYWVDELEEIPAFGYDFTGFSMAADGVTYEDENYIAVRGIDVSEFQRTIDWDAVKADGIDFAIIRVGGRLMQSGTIFEDACFRQNVEGALAAGVQVGVYFFSQAINEAEGLEEAEYVLSLIEGYDITMPVVADWEYFGYDDVRVYGVEPNDLTAGVAAFCRRVKEAGYTPMVYMNTYCGYLKLNLRMLSDVDFWFAQYSDAPAFRYHFAMWQYSDRGQVKGINGNVDMNLYFVPRDR